MSEKPTIQWVRSSEGYYHAMAFTETSMITGFPQENPTMWPTLGALIIDRAHIGQEPRIVALLFDSKKDSFTVVKEYTLEGSSDDFVDWAHQTLRVSLEHILNEWDEWRPFISRLFQETLVERAQEADLGQVYVVNPDEVIES